MQNKMQTLASNDSTNKGARQRQAARIGILFVLTVLSVATLVTASSATGNISKGDLAGNWVATLGGNTGCGLAAMEVKFTLNAAGTGTATITTHAQCADNVLSGQTFTVSTLAANGSGTAGLSCGVGCGWSFAIQVSPDRSTFNLVDVNPANPNNYLQGVAIHQ
jgi:hypothetical protein